jgi:hypothetical protein
MPHFSYTASDSQGSMHKGEIEASDHADLVQKLTDMGLFLVSSTDPEAVARGYDKTNITSVLHEMEKRRDMAPLRKRFSYRDFFQRLNDRTFGRLPGWLQYLLLGVLVIVFLEPFLRHVFQTLHPPEPWKGQIPPSG